MDAITQKKSRKRSRSTESGTEDGHHPDMLPPSDFAPLQQHQQTVSFTGATKCKFLAQGGSLAGANTSEAASDEAPANESQLDRKRRLNRNNERKKRAKKVLKIEDLTSQFHDLTNQGEALKTESKELLDRIAAVKQYMKDQHDKKPAAFTGTPCAADSVRARGGTAHSLERQLLSSAQWLSSSQQHPKVLGSPLSSAKQAKPPGAAAAPPPSAAAAAAAVASSAMRLSTPPPVASKAAGTTSAPAASSSQAFDLSFISSERRVLLLKQEFEKQENILALIRLQAGGGYGSGRVGSHGGSSLSHGTGVSTLQDFTAAMSVSQGFSPRQVAATYTRPTPPPQQQHGSHNPLAALLARSQNGRHYTVSLSGAAHDGSPHSTEVERILLQRKLLAALQGFQNQN